MTKPLHPSLVVFDMAGTTVDEDNLVYKTLRDAITAVGYPVDLELVLRHAAGMEKYRGIVEILAAEGCDTATTKALATKAFSHFKQQLTRSYEEAAVRAQPGADEFFEWLREQKVKVVLNTGYDRTTAEQLLAKLGWRIGTSIDGLVTASDVSQGRPEPDMIYLAMEQTGVGDAAAVMKVGDSIVDIQEGRNAGCGWVVGITTGAHGRETLAKGGADLLVDGLLELRAVFED